LIEQSTEFKVSL